MYISNEDGLDYLKEWLVSEGYDEEEVEERTGLDDFEHYFYSDITHRYYQVLGEEEFFDEVYDEVLDKVWTFSPHFISEHAENWNEDLEGSIEDAIEVCQWNLNPIILALIGDENINEFIYDAIREYGVDEFMDSYYTVYETDDYIIFESDFEY